MKDEILEVVDKEGNVIGLAPRSEIHGNPSLIHRVVHVLVFTSKGALILQKRSMNKDVAPGRWDTSVGGHVDPGETLQEAAERELNEELGITSKPRYLYSYIHSNDFETEIVYTFACIHDGEIIFNTNEIDEVRAWSMQEMSVSMDNTLLSDNFKHEFSIYLKSYGV